jgi:hypothetical protein
MGGTCSIRDTYKILIRKPQGKNVLARHRRRWDIFIKMFLKDIEYEGVDRIRQAHDRVYWKSFVNKVKYGGLLTALATISFSKRTILYGVSYRCGI